MNSVYGGLRANPREKIPSGSEEGQLRETAIELEIATPPAASRIFAGLLDQNQSPPVRDEKRVKKSETDTLR
jgi:hypothetical protein